jgi:hypothetical protein
MGTDDSPEMSVSYYQLTPRKIPEKRRAYVRQVVGFKIIRTAGFPSLSGYETYLIRSTVVSHSTATL